MKAAVCRRPGCCCHGRWPAASHAHGTQQNQQARRLAGLLHVQGHSLPQIAQELNEGGYRTRRGNLFFSMSVQRLLPTAATN
jgi:hypothetical protein